MSVSRDNNGKASVGGGMAIGVAIGLALGVALDNITVGIAVGVALGGAVGAFQRRASGDHIDHDASSDESPN